MSFGPAPDWGRRPATPADLAWLESTHVAALFAIAHAAFGVNEPTFRELFRSELDIALCDVIVADGADVGYIVVEDHREFWFIELIAIAPAHQRRGIGSAVMRAVMDLAPVPVQLTVLHTNPGARALYERLGFRVTGSDAVRTRMEWRWSA